MPHIEIKLYPGYGEEKKHNFVQSVVAAAVQELGVPERVVSVAIEEVAPEAWAERVYQPLIADRAELVKPPQYN